MVTWFDGVKEAESLRSDGLTSVQALKLLCRHHEKGICSYNAYLGACDYFEHIRQVEER